MQTLLNYQFFCHKDLNKMKIALIDVTHVSAMVESVCKAI